MVGTLGYAELKKFAPHMLKSFQDLKDLAQRKNKTKKIKACIATMDFCIARLKVLDELLKVGAGEDIHVANIVIQKSLYLPVFDYWVEVIGK